MTYTKEDIQDNIIKWTSNNLHNFEFRAYQLDAITFIIDSILNDTHETMIIEAPTGSGKSLLNIIAACVLFECYGKKSYILCSDLYLWKQYADFITENDLNIGMLKGLTGNYICDRNGQDLKMGLCKLANVSYNMLKDGQWCEDHNFTCVNDCKYMQDRFKAEATDVTLLTYQLWLYFMNMVPRNDGAMRSFDNREIIFCDECHNIPSIIQQFANPSINRTYDINKITNLLEFAQEQDYTATWHNKTFKYTDVEITNTKNKLFDCFDTISNTNLPNLIYEKFKDYLKELYVVQYACETILADCARRVNRNADLKQHFLKILHDVSWFTQYYSMLQDFRECIHICGVDNLIKNNNIDNDNIKSISFSCAKEDVMINKYVLKQADYKVMMSATVGNKEAFDDNLGIRFTKKHESALVRIPSTFDFSKSPIYIVTKYKLSKNTIDSELPKVAQLITKVVNSPKHVNERGIIHTGSYKNAQKLYELLPVTVQDRCFIYGTAKEKNAILRDYMESDDGIMLGPTLTEGINLPDDLCRFIIIMKIPFPNLGDELVLRKSKLFPTWYNSETSNVVIQSIGRGNRHKDDYCTTYILDGNFVRLYTQTSTQYPQELKNRFKFINYGV